MTNKLFDPSRSPRLLRLVGAAAALGLCPLASRADTATVASDAQTLLGDSSSVSYTLSLANARTWSNLPGFSRNGPTIGGGPLALSTDLSATGRADALSLATAALSDAGYTEMNEIRLADDLIRSTANVGGFDWNYSNYHVAVLGTPSATTPFLIQFGGHHLAYNLAYNAPYVSATPMFLGTEPTEYYRLPSSNSAYPNYAVVKGTINGATSYYITNPDKTSNGSSSNVTITTTDPGVSSGTKHAPLETQRAAVSALATSLQADSTNASAGKLSGTFSDVVMGVTNSGDGNFPFIGTNPTYPTGTSGRGVLYSSLTSAEKAQVKTVIEAWVNTQAAAVSAPLLADYESDAALAATYVGYQVGSGAADGGSTRANFDADIYTEATPINSQNSYLRLDGPRVWIEFVVQASIAYRSQNWVHYHSLYRDKLADYGNEFGGYLDTTSTATTYTRPAITTQPASYSVTDGGSATFSVVATGTGTLSYQWYKDSVAISGATSSTYTVSDADSTDAGSYYVVLSNVYGTTTSTSGTLTVTTNTGTTPTITTQPVSKSVNEGDAVTFSVVASGTGTLSYQWYKDSVAIDGATATSYAIASVATTDAGSYDCIVSNNVGSITSSSATLTVTTATGGVTPTISSQPVSLSASVGAGVTFSVAATGSATLTYQWYKDAVAISGAVNSSYTIASVAESDAGDYYVTVTNSVGSVTSSSAVLTVNATVVPSVNLTVGGDGTFFEHSETGKAVFTRSGGDTTTAVTVYYKVKGTAVNGTDYVDNTTKAAATGTVVVPAGATKVKVKLKGTGDTLSAGTATVVFKLLASPTGAYTVGSATKAKLYLSN